MVDKEQAFKSAGREQSKWHTNFTWDILGNGTLDASSAANVGIEVSFLEIRKPHEVKELIRRLQRGEPSHQESIDRPNQRLSGLLIRRGIIRRTFSV